MPLLERTSDGPKLTAAGETLDGPCRRRHHPARRGRAGARRDRGARGRAASALISFPTASATARHPGHVDLPPALPRRSSCSWGEGEPEESLPRAARGEYDIAARLRLPPHPEDFGRDLERELILEETDAGRAAAGAPACGLGDASSSRTSPTRTGFAAAAELLPRARDQPLPGAPASSRGSPSRATTTRCSKGLVAGRPRCDPAAGAALGDAPRASRCAPVSGKPPSPPGLGGHARGRLTLARGRGDAGDPRARSASATETARCSEAIACAA